MKLPVFLISLAAETATILLVLLGLVKPEIALWPPGPNRRGRGILPVLFYLSGFSLILLGILDWGAGAFPAWLRAAGALPWLVGNILAIWGGWTLGTQGTHGGNPGLVTTGPYRWTRNPQYLGFILALVGWGLLGGSKLTILACLGACLPLYLVPRLEEPWLLENYQDEYLQYLGQVPRFFTSRK